MSKYNCQKKMNNTPHGTKQKPGRRLKQQHPVQYNDKKCNKMY